MEIIELYDTFNDISWKIADARNKPSDLTYDYSSKLNASCLPQTTQERANEDYCGAWAWAVRIIFHIGNWIATWWGSRTNQTLLVEWTHQAVSNITNGAPDITEEIFRQKITEMNSKNSCDQEVFNSRLLSVQINAVTLQAFIGNESSESAHLGMLIRAIDTLQKA